LRQGGVHQFDLDHHSAYTWQINNVLPAGRVVTGASITFTSTRNWDTNANMLFIHLLDSANSFATASGNRSATSAAGVTSFQDVDPNQSPVTTISDAFGADLATNPLVGASVGNQLLVAHSFNTTSTNYTYNLTAAQVAFLAAYIANGNNIALGFDPDCHFWNDGITLTITYGPAVPESASMLLLGSGLSVGGLFLRRRRRQK
jgi:hypothetical protein